ncbi:MAG: PIN domain-containing protein [Candidatus Micrarchaeota archaeon]|nr:PIN domain-containing protein [Candidatus Micrarchaeota archaeon]
MKLIVDSNALFAALIRNSTARKIISHYDAEFFIISANQEELEEYQEELIEKSKIGKIAFQLVLDNVTKKCILVEDTALLVYWKEAKEIMDSIDSDDTPFIAAALATGADIWSDDPHFTKQKKIKIWKTEDLVKFL